jgi:hexulose-6-phosphate isomerase
MRKAILLASDIGVRVIQVAGYDVYYEKPDQDTDRWFLENFALCEDMAKQSQVMLAFEIMDTPYINSISRFMNLKRTFPSCWTAVYPDVGNLSAWGNDIEYELKLGADWTVAIHLKDTLAVFSGFEGKFKEVPFGTGCVDFIKVFQVLNSLRYKGPFLIEMWSEKSGNPEQEIIIARDFILKKMKESGYLN